MLRSDFYYDLPQELIAQTPLEPRDSSRLMKIDRISGEITHDRFYNICDYLKKGDLLVLNDSKVFPARLYGVKQETGAMRRLDRDSLGWGLLEDRERLARDREVVGRGR